MNTKTSKQRNWDEIEDALRRGDIELASRKAFEGIECHKIYKHD